MHTQRAKQTRRQKRMPLLPCSVVDISHRHHHRCRRPHAANRPESVLCIYMRVLYLEAATTGDDDDDGDVARVAHTMHAHAVTEALSAPRNLMCLCVYK